MRGGSPSSAAVVGVEAARGTVVGGGVVGVAVVGGAVVATGGLETGTVVTGAGTSVKITSWVGTVVAGAVAVDGVAERADGAAVTGGATAVVVEVVELTPKRSAGVDGSAAAKRLPTRVVEVGLTTVSVGRVAFTREPLRPASPDVAALTRATAIVPTTSVMRMLLRVVRLLAYHQSRRRSCAGGRPKAAFVPMNEGKR